MMKYGLIWPTVMALSGLVVLVSLGTWQLQRRAWKLELLERIESRVKTEPVALTRILERPQKTNDIDYWPARVNGVFLHKQELHFYDVISGTLGWRIITPLKTSDGKRLLVDRGFVPDHLRDPAQRPQSQIKGEVQITGLIRSPPNKKAFFTPANNIAENQWYWRDLYAMAQARGISTKNLVPFFLDADATPVPGGWPRGGATRLNPPNRHLEYALTWYGLAVTLIAVYGFFVRSRVTK